MLRNYFQTLFLQLKEADKGISFQSRQYFGGAKLHSTLENVSMSQLVT